MRRADRLFQLVQLMRSRDVVTAKEIASELEVSLRTVYRDVSDLTASGVPIDGEAGVGYVLDSGFELPPLMFDAEEIGALVLGARMVQAFADEGLAARARSVLQKVALVVPEPLRGAFESQELEVPVALESATRATLRDDDLLLGGEGGLGGRTHDEPAATKPLADVIVRVAGDVDRHPAGEEGADGLAGAAAEVERDRVGGQAIVAPLLADLVREHRARRTIDVA